MGIKREARWRAQQEERCDTKIKVKSIERSNLMY